MKNLYLILSVMVGVNALASDEKVKFGGFVDTYYAYDFNEPNNGDRAFTTQPARHNEFNINLAYIEAVLSDENVHGRLALQVGTSVQSNYSSEPTRGGISGALLSRHIQEAYAGYQVFEKLWIDAGIYLSHIGAESFISKDNPIYTRSLVADYSPYYQSGIRMSYQYSAPLSFQLHLINGWQNISENNNSKSVGTQVTYAFSEKNSITYNTYFGKEAAFRHFHDFIFKAGITNQLSLGFQADVGFQKQTVNDETYSWYGMALIPRYAITPKVAIAGRVERYVDPHQVVVATSTSNGFQTWGSSLGLDIQLHQRLVWRSEVRGFWSKDAVYTKKSGSHTDDWMTVTSFGVNL